MRYIVVLSRLIAALIFRLPGVGTLSGMGNAPLVPVIAVVMALPKMSTSLSKSVSNIALPITPIVMRVSSSAMFRVVPSCHFLTASSA